MLIDWIWREEEEKMGREEKKEKKRKKRLHGVCAMHARLVMLEE